MTDWERPIRTPDQRLRVFVSSTLKELAEERQLVREAVEEMRLTPVMFELGARPHPPRALYRAYLQQSDIFVGIYWRRYGWIAPEEDVSGLEDEYRLAGSLPQLLYIKEPAPDREPRLKGLLEKVQGDDRASYRSFESSEQLRSMVRDDLATLLSEGFRAGPSTPTDGLLRRVARPPAPASPTVGRRADVEAVVGLLRSGHRLVTVTGPGGIGKTRLVIEVADTLASVFEGGVAFVGLATVQDPELVLPSVAQALGVSVEHGRERLLEAIAAATDDAPTLVVVDNLEHLVRAAADLSALLEAGPGTVILATSRHVLRVRHEQEFPLAPLAPESALQLFADRAAAVRPGFSITTENRAVMEELCRRLDGLPLAIELAAARLRLLSPRDLVNHLSEHIELLGRGPTDLPERQRTLRGTMDWSYGLLDQPERALFAELAVFSGGWTLGAADAVCTPPEGSAVLDIMSSLVEKSLVVPPEAFGSEPRLHMLETVRAYANEKLRQHADRAEVERRHTEWVVGFSREALRGISSPEHERWMDRMDLELANLRATVGRALTEGDHHTVALVARNVFGYMTLRDREGEVADWMAEARRQPIGDPATAGRVLVVEALALATTNRGDRARELLDEGWPLLPDDDAHAMDQAMAAMANGVLASMGSRHDHAAAAVEDAARRFARVDYPLGRAYMELNLGGIAFHAGTLDESDRHYILAQDIAETLGEPALWALAQTMRGFNRLTSGEVAEARELFAIAARRSRDNQQWSSVAHSVEGLAAAALASHRVEAAARALGAADVARRKIGHPPWAIHGVIVDDLVRRARDELGETAFGSAWSEGEAWSLSEAVDRTLAALEAEG